MSFIANKASQDALNKSLVRISNALYGKFISAKKKILSLALEEPAKTEALRILKDSYTKQKDFIKKDEALFQLEAESLEIREEDTNLQNKIKIITDNLHDDFLNYENAEVSFMAQNNLSNAHVYYKKIKTLLVRIKEIDAETQDLAVKTQAMIKHYSHYEAALSSSDDILEITKEYEAPKYEAPKIEVNLPGIEGMEIIDGRIMIRGLTFSFAPSAEVRIDGTTLSFKPGAEVEISGSYEDPDSAHFIANLRGEYNIEYLIGEYAKSIGFE